MAFRARPALPWAVAAAFAGPAACSVLALASGLVDRLAAQKGRRGTGRGDERTEQPMSISEKITEGMGIKAPSSRSTPSVSISPISDTVIATWIIMAVLMIATLLLTRRFREIPKKPQLLLESFIGFIDDFVKEKIGHHGKDFVAFLGTIFIFLIAANLAPMLTPVGRTSASSRPSSSSRSPATSTSPRPSPSSSSSPSSSRAFVQGPKGYLKSLVSPSPVMLPFNLMEYAIKPMSLCLRLFGNILGAYIIMLLIEGVAPVVVPPVVGLYFDLFDGLIQAVVFAFLSTIYIAEAIE